MTRFDPDVLLRLSRPGPRYTSYPTVPVWTEPADDAGWHAALARTAGPVSVYVHVPFCKDQCAFCGCNMVVARRQDAGDAYLDLLSAQLASLPLAPATLPAVRVHLGGGTPTWLTPDQLGRLYALVRSRFHTLPGAELSVEVDPEVTSDGHVGALVEAGVTRLSVGVQSFDPVVLAAIHRHQDEDRVADILAVARRAGMRGLNLDLVYGLPYQDAASLARTIAAVLAMRPDRLALYAYAHVPWLKRHQRLIPEDALPDPVARVHLYLQALETLEAAGYRAIGMDHFALPDDELSVAQGAGRLHRNFMGYTTRAELPLIGLGMSSISELDGYYAQQQPALGAWNRAARAGERLIHRECRLTAEDRLRREVISELLCNHGVDLDAVAARHGRDRSHFAEELGALRALEDEGVVAVAGGRLALTPLGRIVVRNVAMVFDAHLSRGGRFSQTV